MKNTKVTDRDIETKSNIRTGDDDREKERRGDIAREMEIQREAWESRETDEDI